MYPESANTNADFTQTTVNAEELKLAVKFAPLSIHAYSVIANVVKLECLTVTGLSLPPDKPKNLIAIIRDPLNNNSDISDLFMLSVNKINSDCIIFTIWKTDASNSSSIAIRIDFFVVVDI